MQWSRMNMSNGMLHSTQERGNSAVSAMNQPDVVKTIQYTQKTETGLYA